MYVSGNGFLLKCSEAQNVPSPWFSWQNNEGPFTLAFTSSQHSEILYYFVACVFPCRRLTKPQSAQPRPLHNHIVQNKDFYKTQNPPRERTLSKSRYWGIKKFLYVVQRKNTFNLYPTKQWLPLRFYYHSKPSLQDRAVFTWVLKVIRVCFGFALPRSTIDLKISRHFVIQSDVKPKPIVTRSHLIGQSD